MVESPVRGQRRYFRAAQTGGDRPSSGYPNPTGDSRNGPRELRHRHRAVPFAFGIAGLLGLRPPLRLAPIQTLQVIYESAFLVGVVLPLLVADSVPGYVVPVIAIFVGFIAGGLIALPILSVLSPAPDRSPIVGSPACSIRTLY